MPSGHAAASRELLAVARLAMGGLPADPESLDWPTILRVAIEERCVALAWARAGAGIRAGADPVVVAQWRGAVLSVHDRAWTQLRTLVMLSTQLAAIDTRLVVLKGLPLAQRLYGDFTLRPTIDLDVLVPAEQRSRVHRTLVAAGWTHVAGTPPAETAYQHGDGGDRQSLEVHSSILDDNIVAHLPALRADVASIEIGGQRLVAHAGPSLAVFLAIHLAKHAAVPVLWWIDFATLWASLDGEARTAAESLATSMRAGGYLRWAVAGAALLDAVGSAEGDRAMQALVALRLLHSRRTPHRVAALASTLRDRLTVYAAWAWPRQLRGNLSGSIRHAAVRLARRFAPDRQPAPAVNGPRDRGARDVGLARGDFVEFVREAVCLGGAVSVRAKGGSMAPAIPRGAAVRLVAVNARDIRRGMVVLATLPSGQPVLHRVRRVANGAVYLKGDNTTDPDPPTPLDAVIAVARSVSVSDEEIALERRPRPSLRSAAFHWRIRLRRRLARA